MNFVQTSVDATSSKSTVNSCPLSLFDTCKFLNRWTSFDRWLRYNNKRTTTNTSEKLKTYIDIEDRILSERLSLVKALR